MRNVNKIIIHCTATPEGRKTTLDEITSWHKARGFRTIGYHYVIHIDGRISPGRMESEIGAHCKGQNSNSIGIAYVGGMDRLCKKPKDTRTEMQKIALYELIDTLKETYKGATVHCHNEFANKACPSFKIDEL